MSLTNSDYLKKYDILFEYLKLMSMFRPLDNNVELDTGRTIKYIDFFEIGDSGTGFQNELVAHINDNDYLGLSLDNSDNRIKLIKNISVDKMDKIEHVVSISQILS